MENESDKIICPSCNADLKNQYSFDEARNVNICSSCGTELLNPESEDNYIWHCNKCGDILNNQYTWEGETGKLYRCSRCFVLNDLSDPESTEYWESESEYNNKELFCPECKAKLNDQLSFIPTKNVYICSSCGKEIFNTHCKDEYIWHCNKCGDILNNQSSWEGENGGLYKCSKCDSLNDLSDHETDKYWENEEDYYNDKMFSIFDEKEEYDDDDDEDDEVDVFRVYVKNPDGYPLDEYKPDLSQLIRNVSDVREQVKRTLDYFDYMPDKKELELTPRMIQAICNWNFIFAYNKSFKKHGDGSFRKSRFFHEISDNDYVEAIDKNNYKKYKNTMKEYDDVLPYNYMRCIEVCFKMYDRYYGAFHFIKKRRNNKKMEEMIQRYYDYWISRVNNHYNQRVYGLYEELDKLKKDKKTASMYSTEDKKECAIKIKDIEMKLLMEDKKLKKAYEAVETGDVPYEYMKE